MGQKDISEKILESYNDVFSDIVNVLLFDGEEILKPEELEEQAPRYPVITLVLYFGYNQRWDEPLSLVECLKVPDKFKPFVNDYKVNLFEIAFLDEEKVGLFTSDFKVVADYFVQMRKNGDYVPNATTLVHVKETLALLSIMTGDHRFEDALNSNIDYEDGKEIRNMCEVLDRIENKGIAKGRAEGRAEGRVEGKIATIVELVRDGLLSITNAAMKLGMSEEEFCKKYPMV